MEPIERELADLKLQLERTLSNLAHSEHAHQLETDRKKRRRTGEIILRLRALISRLRERIHECEDAIRVGRSSWPDPPPPLWRARMLSVAECQRIETETRERILATVSDPRSVEVRVTVGRVTDINGTPKITVAIVDIPPNTPREE